MSLIHLYMSYLVYASFVEYLRPGRVPGMLVLVAQILHVFVVGVDGGLNEVNQ